MVEILDTDEAEAFGQTLIQPEPEAADVDDPNVTPSIPRGAPLKPSGPDDPIKAMLDGWMEGDAKVKAVQDLARHFQDDETRAMRYINAQRAVDDYRASLTPSDMRKKPVREELNRLNAELKEAAAWEFRRGDKIREEIGKILKAKEPIEHVYTDKTPKNAGGLRKTIKTGMDWLMPLIERGTSWGVEFRGESPPGTKRASGGFTWIRLPKATEPQTVVHEIGHVLEDQLKGVGQLGKDFLAYRARGQEPRKFKDLFPDHNYREDETGVDDEFGKYFSPEGSDGKFGKTSSWYVGKYYAKRSEIISMGLEALYVDGVRFAQQDPEYCKFIVGVLAGEFR